MLRPFPSSIQAARLTRVFALLACLSLLAACSDDDGAAPGSDPSSGPPSGSESNPGSSDTSSATPGTSAPCDDSAQQEHFVEHAWPVLGTTCFACHGGSSIGALGSDLRLVEVRSQADHETNFRTAREIALREEDGRSILLRKPLGELNHGGAAQLTEEHPGYAALAEFVRRVQDDTCDGGSGTDATPDGLASLTWNDDAPSVRVGRVIPITLRGRNAEDQDVRVPDGVVLTVADDSIARVEGTTRLRGLAEGTTTVVARVGDVESPPLTVTVRPNPDFGTASIRIVPETLALAPGSSYQLGAAVRERTGEPVLGATVLWRSDDAAVASVDEHGEVTANTVGTARIYAEFEGASSPPLPVQVTGASARLDVRWTLPSGDAMASGRVHLAADVRRYPVDNPHSFGTPVQASSAVLLVNGAEANALETSISGARGEFDLSGHTGDELRLRVRATHDGETVESAERVITRVAPAGEGTWADLGGVDPPVWRSLYGVEARMFDLGGVLHLLTNRCGRECSISLNSFDLSNLGGEWRPVNYRQRMYREWDGQPPESVGDSNRIDLPRYQGWGWPSSNAREPHVMPNTAERIVTWSNEDARTRFNLEGEPETYWNDCHVARWSSSAGFDGQGGWRLLSTENPSFLDDLRHDTMPEERGDQRHPAGVDAVRTEDCMAPHIGMVDDQPVVAYVATPIPSNHWRLRLRRWTGDRWEDAGPTFDLPKLARLRDMVVDGEGRVVVAIDTDTQDGELLRLSGGAWRPLGLGLPAMAVRSLSGEALVAATLSDGDLSVYRYDGSSWQPLGGRLNRGVWTPAHSVDLVVSGDRVAVAWTEGPEEGNRTAHVAAWRADREEWEVTGDAPVDLSPDARAIDVRLVIDGSGHVIVTYAEPNVRDDDLQGGSRNWFRRVRRSAEPVY